MDDDHSIIIDIPVPRVCAKASNITVKPSYLKRTFKKILEKRKMKNHSDTSLMKYSLPINKPMHVSDIKRAEFLLPYKLYSKIEHSEKHKNKLSISLRDQYKVINTDLRNRLHVEDPCDDVHAITDIDQSFYDYVNGRAVRDSVPLFQSLMSLLSDKLRIRQDIGYRKDDALNIETNHGNELEIFDISLQRFTEQAKYFDYFISEDYHKSMALLHKGDQLKIKLNKKISELENLATEQFTITSRLMNLDYLYGLQQKYGRFLYYLSPPIWRSKNREFARSVEIEEKGFDLGNSEEETFTIVFEKMQKECFTKLVKPVLYFSHPKDLLHIFEGIEKQQLRHYIHVNHLAPLKKVVKEEAKMLKDLIQKESALFVTTIKSFETLLKFYDERREYLKKKFYKILNGTFYESVGAPEVLSLFLNLEFCFEKIFSEKPLTMDIVIIAKSLENFSMNYIKRLEAVHGDTTKKAISNCLQIERNKFKKAEIARRELRFFDRLERDLLRAFKPPPGVNNHRNSRGDIKKLPIIERPVIRKTVKRQYSKLSCNKSDRKILSESQIEYLQLFTDWTQNEDPAKYLHFEE